MAKTQTRKKMFARTLNPNTMMWEFEDKSGVSLPNEVMQKIVYYILLSSMGVHGASYVALLTKWSYEDIVRTITTEDLPTSK